MNEYPWMVGLKRSGSSRPSCGATLINSQWLITAGNNDLQSTKFYKTMMPGHCVVDSYVLDVALIGEHDVTTDQESLITIVITHLKAGAPTI